jgi:hypothetical protein
VPPQVNTSDPATGGQPGGHYTCSFLHALSRVRSCGLRVQTVHLMGFPSSIFLLSPHIWKVIVLLLLFHDAL